jgi:nucleoside-diphosphate-sugar epimerase
MSFIMVVVSTFGLCVRAVSGLLHCVRIPSFAEGGATGALPIAGITISISASAIILFFIFHLNSVHKERLIAAWADNHGGTIVGLRKSSVLGRRDGAMLSMITGSRWEARLMPSNKPITITYGNLLFGDLDWAVDVDDQVHVIP